MNPERSKTRTTQRRCGRSGLGCAVVFVTRAVSSCSGTAVVHDEFPPHEVPKSPTFVLATAHSWLATAPVATAIAAHDPLGSATQPYRLRVIGRRGAWLAVQTGDRDDDTDGTHCTGPMPGLAGLRLRLWLREADTLPVLATTQAAQFANGTGYLVPAGVALGPPVAKLEDGAAWHGVQAVEYLTTLRLPASAIGRCYAPAAALSAPATASADSALIAKGTRLQLGDGALLVVGQDDGRWADLILPAPGDSSAVIAQLDGGCARFWVKVPRTALSRSAGGLGLLGSLGHGPARWQWRRGTALYWPDGRPAGETTQAVDVGRDLGSTDGRRCFAWPLGSWWPKGQQPPQSAGLAAHELPLCSAAGDVVPPQPVPAKPRY